MKVLITDKINEAAGKILEGTAQVDYIPTLEEAELAEKIKDYDALMVRSQTKVTKKIIESGKNLKIVGRAGVGVDNIDIESATQNGVIVVNSPDGNTNAAAEHTIALMLAMSRNIPAATASTKAGKWERSKFTGVEVFGKTLGIIGFGKIGHHVANVALALGMKVIVSDPYTTKEAVEKIGAKYAANLDEFWGQCDYITIHTPKTKETASLINRNTLNRMKKGVRIINCARGGIIDEAALKEALESGQVAAAALDVYETEPDITASPLYNCGCNVTMTPHLGASTAEAQFNVAIDVAEQIKEVLTGGSAKAAINIPALKADILEPVKEYMQLAENLGALVQQLSKGNLKNININVNGNLAELNIAPLEVAVQKGIFSSTIEGVNFVNAPLIAERRGINITTSKSQKDCTFIGSISVTLTTDTDENTVTGALIAKNMPRIVRINDYNMSIEAEKHMLIVPHENKPSMVAKVAAVIGEHNININRMQVAQKSNTKDNVSIMIITTDKDVDDSTMDTINKINGIQNAQY
ncbi:MAG: phosphoglycerate dehydrogenase, partial [Candidatus Gastranaerophilales bacterium]|nr:phosphoglycerate dehydrogenase [Candidatus Gastranaerophilales bacterium]